MSRDLQTSVSNALDDEVVYPFFSVDLNFLTQSLYFWTGYGELEIDGTTYLGAGHLLQISSIEETSEIAARGATLTLSGIPSETLSLALSEPYQGRLCKIYFGFTSAPADRAEIFSGYMDQMNIDEGADTSSIQLQVENKLIDLERQRVSRYTSAYQKSKYPGDLGLDFVESLQDKQVVWGRSAE